MAPFAAENIKRMLQSVYASKSSLNTLFYVFLVILYYILHYFLIFFNSFFKKNYEIHKKLTICLYIFTSQKRKDAKKYVL